MRILVIRIQLIAVSFRLVSIALREPWRFLPALGLL
jgi:hypothetical protein